MFIFIKGTINKLVFRCADLKGKKKQRAYKDESKLLDAQGQVETEKRNKGK